MLSQIKKRDLNLMRSYLNTRNKSHIEVPSQYVNNFCRFAGASDVSYIINERFLKGADGLDVLIVGLHGGRDYWSAVTQGWNVWGLDLNEFNFPQTKVGNVEDPWPFESESFDLVIIGEVLEHLFLMPQR